jgi:hypothetical protein
MPSTPNKPLPLTSALRAYPSSLDAPVRLTQPHGSIYGGPCPVSPTELRAYAQDVAEVNGRESKRELEAWVRGELARRAEELEARMRERKRYVESNGRIRDKVHELEEEREMEIKVAERWRTERRRRR